MASEIIPTRLGPPAYCRKMGVCGHLDLARLIHRQPREFIWTRTRDYEIGGRTIETSSRLYSEDAFFCSTSPRTIQNWLSEQDSCISVVLDRSLNLTPRTTFRVQSADFDFVYSSLAHLVRSAPSGILHTSIRRQPLDQFSLPNSKGFGSLPKLKLFLLYRRLARSCRFPYML